MRAEEYFVMEMAKVTSKGQITIPISIRRRLDINEGDKLLFINRPDGVMMVNPDKLPGEKSSSSFEYEAYNTEQKLKNKVAARQADKQPKPVPVHTAAEPEPEVVAAVPEPEPAPEPVAAPASTHAPAPVQKAKVPAFHEEPLPEDDKDKHTEKHGVNIHTLLDEIRSIGTRI